MARKKNNGSDLPPAVLEYKPPDSTVKWRIEHFDELAAELEFDARAKSGEVMARFHAFVGDKERFWILCRRLYGIAPVIPPPETAPDDLRIWSKPEMQGEGFDVVAELEALRAMWNEHRQREALPEGGRSDAPRSETVREGRSDAPRSELGLDDKLLEQYQFSERMFKIMVWDPVGGVGGEGENETRFGKDVPRPEGENRLERAWFIQRIKEWSKMLSDPIAGEITRAALMNALYLRRVDAEIAVSQAKDRDKLYSQKKSLETAYQTQIEKLQEMFPEMDVAGRVSFRQVISDMNLAHRDFYGHADRRLLDKIFSSTEVEFLLRTSAQLKQPRYRFSLNLAIVEAIHGLYDPNFRSQLKGPVLKQIEAGFRAAVNAAREAQNQPVVDLEKGVLPGSGDDFEDLNDRQCSKCGQWINREKCPHCGTENKQEAVA